MAALGGTAFPEIGAKAKPVFSPDAADLGVLMEGVYHPFEVELKNVSGKKIKVLKYESSCGCTLVNGPVGYIQPGGTLRLKGEMDTTAKIGKVVKVIDIHTESSAEPFSLFINAFVEHDPTHDKDSSTMFQGKCATCHAPLSSMNQFGKDLYDSVCAICHKGEPAFAVKEEAPLAAITRNGLHNTSMPGFGDEAGGPLTPGQIDSIVQYLVNVQKGK